jgi:hypothetical protein
VRLEPLHGFAPAEYGALLSELAEDRRRAAGSHAFRESHP